LSGELESIALGSFSFYGFEAGFAFHLPLNTRHGSLEDLFVAMTGRHIREDAEATAT
jgi:hypothetical protein